MSAASETPCPQVDPDAYADGQLRDRALRGFKWITIGNWASQASGALVLYCLAVILGPGDFGLYSIASALVFMLGSLAEQGLSLALVQKDRVVDEDYDTAFWATLVIGGLLCALLVIGRGPLAEWMAMPGLESLIAVCSCAIVLRGVSGVFSAALVRSLDFGRATVVTILATLSGAAAALAALFAGAGIWSLAAQTVVGGLVGLAATAHFSPYRPGMRFSSANLVELWRFGGLTLVGDLTSVAAQRLPALLIGSLLGAHAAGLYAMGRRVIELGGQLVLAGVGQLSMPVFARLQDDRVRLTGAYLTALRMTALASFPLYLLLAVLSPALVGTFLSHKWAEAVPVMQLLAAVAALDSLFWLGNSLALASGRPGLRIAMPGSNLLLSVAACLAGAPFGIVGVAVALAVKVLAMTVLHFSLVRRVVPLSVPELVRQLTPVVLASVAGALSAYAGLQVMAGQPAVLGLAMGGLLGGLGFAVMQLVLDPALVRNAASYLGILLGRRA